MEERECPKCGLGAMPETDYCLRCGTKLPELPPRPGIEKGHGRLGRLGVIVDLLPGLFRLDTLLHVLCAWAVGGAMALLGFTFMAGGRGAALTLAPCVGTSTIGALICFMGLTWAVQGYFCNPVEALADFKPKDWLVFATVALMGMSVLMKIALVIRAH